MKAEEEKNPLPQPHDATQALKRSLEIFSGAKAVASEIEFQAKGDSWALHPAAQNILANAAHTVSLCDCQSVAAIVRLLMSTHMYSLCS
jgi:hypothetical protein